MHFYLEASITIHMPRGESLEVEDMMELSKCLHVQSTRNEGRVMSWGVHMLNLMFG